MRYVGHALLLVFGLVLGDKEEAFPNPFDCECLWRKSEKPIVK